MSTSSANTTAKSGGQSAVAERCGLLFFSQLLKLPVYVGTTRKRQGKLTDLVFKLTETYPEAVGIYVEHRFGEPTELIPWNRVTNVKDNAISILPPETGDHYPPFVDERGWILVDEHLMGRTVFDINGRRTEVVNDVHLLTSQGRMLLVHVDVSFNGFLPGGGCAGSLAAKTN